MTKNVIVVDELGNEYAPTYAKRARGLVKQGRARWLDGNTICLACPPDIIDSEDNEMENMEQIAEVMENIEVVEDAAQSAAEITKADILARMDKIIAQGEELSRVMQTIHDLPVNESEFGGNDGKARAEAIRDIYVRREVTNQKMLDMLDEMLHPDKGRRSVVDKLVEQDFAGVMPETAEKILNFIERNS